ncbi:branched-chain amino acid transport system II carrier protein [Leuconostocaceae bacterium ESL0723]|nr:branched-chain amino acid transport system II carrier protein [Leuconostocaceae bacterium ESL0723]
MKEQKLTFKQLILLASLIFGMFFGAGNLIFPVQLGQLAGHNWLPAALGFLLTGALVPFLAMLAISITGSKSVYDLAAPVGPWFAMIILIGIHLTLGPLVATPRTAATAFAMGISPLVKPEYQQIAMLIFSAIFFGLVYLLSVRQAGLTKWIGKYLNPLFLIFLGILFLAAFFLPMGNLSQAVGSAYQHHAAFQGVLDGYNTMDGLALLGFAVSSVYAAQAMGFTGKAVPKVLARAGLLSIAFEALVYLALVLLGVSSLGLFKPAENGGVAFGQIVSHYAGNLGVLLTGVIVTLAVFTTAMGLSASFAQDMHRVFPKISYTWWLRVVAIGAFVVANAGLTNIVKWAVPVLMLLYPYALSLITLAVLNRWVKQSPVIYRATMLLVTVPAILDALSSSALAQTSWVQAWHQNYVQVVPLAAEGFGWLVPALIGAAIGTLIHWYQHRSNTSQNMGN